MEAMPTVSSSVEKLPQIPHISLTQRHQTIRHPEKCSKPENDAICGLASVRSIKNPTILTICYAAGLRVSEAVCLKVTDVDSQRMVIRVEQGKGLRDRYVMLSPKLLKILQDWWRVDKPKEWLFPGDRVSGHISRFAVEEACQRAHQRSYIAK